MVSMPTNAMNRSFSTAHSAITQIIMLQNYPVQNFVSIEVKKTKFFDGNFRVDNAGMNIFVSNRVNCNLSIINCEFHKGNHLLVWAKNYSAIMKVIIETSVFIGSTRPFGVNIQSRGAASKMIVIFRKCIFRSNENVGLRISNALYAEITNCSFTNNKDGVWIFSTVMISLRGCLVHNNRELGMQIAPIKQGKTAEISKINFFNNSRALSIRFRWSHHHAFKISECSFTNHRISHSHIYNAAVTIEGNQVSNHANSVTIENSSLVGNEGFHGDCSALLIQNMNNLTLSNVNITGNNCTGMTLFASKMKLTNTIILARNHGLQGGALSLKKSSKLTLTALSRVHIINNTASIYGGGIYSDVACNYNIIRMQCFFQFEPGFMSADSEVFIFSGNIAERGGDIVFGGCLQYCYVDLNQSHATINGNDPYLVSSKNVQSPSKFADYPKRVVFCTNTSSSSSCSGGACIHGVVCNSSFTVHSQLLHTGGKYSLSH